MSLFKKLESRKLESGIKKSNFLILAFLILVSGCGFTPMYAQNSENAAVAAKLAAVEIKPIKTIVGQQYVVALKDVLDPSHSGAAPEYSFEATVERSTSPLAIAQNRTVSRYKVLVIVDYTLKEIATGKVLSKAVIRNEDDYDNVSSYYSTHVSENESAKRAVRELAEDTKIKIIAALTN
jgi:LPS-assembly lipoprotein